MRSRGRILSLHIFFLFKSFIETFSYFLFLHFLVYFLHTAILMPWVNQVTINIMKFHQSDNGYVVNMFFNGYAVNMFFNGYAINRFFNGYVCSNNNNNNMAFDIAHLLKAKY